MKKNLTLFLLLWFFCIFGSFFISVQIDKKYPSIEIEDLLYLPSGKFLKGAALSFDEMLADLLWIKSLAYFGGHSLTDKDFFWLDHLIDIVTTLDPLFQYPYEFGGIILATEIKNAEKSNHLLEKGMKNVPKNHERYWYLPFFAAFNHMYYLADNKMAAHYLEIASRFPQAPPYLPKLAAKLYANAGEPEMAIPFLEEIIQGTNNPELKESLQQRLNEIINYNNILLLDEAKKKFIGKFHRLPKTINELVETGTIITLPKDPRGGEYYISPYSDAIENTIATDALKLHIYKKDQPVINAKPAP
jgi:hypothetical protein